MRHALYREIYSVIAFNRRRHILLQKLPDGESNPGLPRDRRGYLPLYYRGIKLVLRSIMILKIHFFMAMSKATVLVHNL